MPRFASLLMSAALVFPSAVPIHAELRNSADESAGNFSRVENIQKAEASSMKNVSQMNGLQTGFQLPVPNASQKELDRRQEVSADIDKTMQFGRGGMMQLNPENVETFTSPYGIKQTDVDYGNAGSMQMVQKYSNTRQPSDYTTGLMIVPPQWEGIYQKFEQSLNTKELGASMSDGAQILNVKLERNEKSYSEGGLAFITLTTFKVDEKGRPTTTQSTLGLVAKNVVVQDKGDHVQFKADYYISHGPPTRDDTDEGNPGGKNPDEDKKTQVYRPDVKVSTLVEKFYKSSTDVNANRRGKITSQESVYVPGSNQTMTFNRQANHKQTVRSQPNIKPLPRPIPPRPIPPPQPVQTKPVVKPINPPKAPPVKKETPKDPRYLGPPIQVDSDEKSGDKRFVGPPIRLK